MRKIAIILTLLFPVLAQGQLAEKESLLSVHAYKGSINKQSVKRKSDKRYTRTDSFYLEEGDQLYYTVQALQSQLNLEIWKADTLLQKVAGRKAGTGYLAELVHRADTADSFAVVITNAVPKETTDFMAKYTIEGKLLNRVGTDSLFCDKVEYLIIHGFESFRLLKQGFVQKDGPESVFNSSFQFTFDFPGQHFVGRNTNRYESTLARSSDHEEALVDYENLKRSFETCLAEYGDIIHDDSGYAIQEVRVKVHNQKKSRHVIAKASLIRIKEIYAVVFAVSSP